MTQVLAARQWTDFAVRPNTSSTEGQVPVTGRIYDCPDIILTTEPVHDPQHEFSTPQSWTTDPGKYVTVGVPNYIYVRARNFASGPEHGTIRLYAVGNELINWPQDWINSPLTVQTSDPTPQTAVPISAQTTQQIVVGGQPFYWVPQHPPSGSDHYCLFSLVDTPATPNPLLHGGMPKQFSDMTHLVDNSLNVGWKNVAEVASDATWTHAVPVSVPPTVGDDRLLHVYVFGTSGTVNADVSFSCGDGQAFNPPLELARTTINKAGETYGMLSMPTPGIARAIVNLTYWKRGSHPGFNDRITVVAGWVPSDLAKVRQYIEAGTARLLPRHLAADTPGWEVAVGAMSYRFTGTA